MTFQDYYRVGAHAIITDSENRILLLKATYRDKFWGLPGGGTDSGETLEATIFRECLEELGCEVEIRYVSGFYYHRKNNSHVAIFRCVLKDGAVIQLSEEHSEYRYADISTLSEVQRIRAEDCLNFDGQVKFRAFL